MIASQEKIDAIEKYRTLPWLTIVYNASYSEVRDLFHQANLLFFPSRLENYGNSLVEAVFHGLLPCVTDETHWEVLLRKNAALSFDDLKSVLQQSEIDNEALSEKAQKAQDLVVEMFVSGYEYNQLLKILSKKYALGQFDACRLALNREITILIVQTAVAICLCFRTNAKVVYAALILSAYGTAMTSTRIDFEFAPLSLGTVFALATTVVFFPKFRVNLTLFLLIIAASTTISAVSLAYQEILKTGLFLIFTAAGLSIGHYFINLASKQKLEFMTSALIILTVGVFMTITMERPYVGFRDVSFGLLAIMPIVYFTFRFSILTILASTMSLAYLVIGMSRGLILGLVVAIFARIISQINFSKMTLNQLLFLVGSSFLCILMFVGIIVIRLYDKPFNYSSKFDWLLQILSLKTRYRSVIFEFEKIF